MTMVSEESDNLFEPSKHKKASVKKSSGFGRIPMSKHYVRIVSNGFAILFTEKGFGSHIKVREIITKYKEIFGLKDTTDEILCSLKEYVTKISVGRLLSQEKRAHNTRSSVSQIWSPPFIPRLILFPKRISLRKSYLRSWLFSLMEIFMTPGLRLIVSAMKLVKSICVMKKNLLGASSCALL